MAKNIHVHIHGKTKDDSSYKGYTIRVNSDYSTKTKKMEPIFQIYGPQAPTYQFETEAAAKASIDKFLNSNKASSAGDIRKLLKETPYPQFGAPLRTWTKDETPCGCQSHAKDATLVHTDKGRTARLYTGVLGKVLEVDEAKKRAYIEVQSAREGTYKMWVDFTEVESL